MVFKRDDEGNPEAVIGYVLGAAVGWIVVGGVIILALLLGGCGKQPPAVLDEVNRRVNATTVYKHYYGRDWRRLKPGESGNCAAISYTKWLELKERGVESEIKICRLTSGEGHAFVVSDGWVLDNRRLLAFPETEMDCQKW